MLKDFEMQLMPGLANTPNVLGSLQHDFVDVNRWKWDNYPILYSLDKGGSFKKASEKQPKGESQ